MFATGETVGLAKWIIDDPCLVFFFIENRFSCSSRDEDNDDWKLFLMFSNKKNHAPDREAKKNSKDDFSLLYAEGYICCEQEIWNGAVWNILIILIKYRNFPLHKKIDIKIII